MTYLEKEKAKLEKKIDELEEKEHEAFLIYQDTGYANMRISVINTNMKQKK